MADIIDLQDSDEVPAEEKGSFVSYAFCRNSYRSEKFCWKW
ncbi:hypothetical protein [Propioniciclava soli]|uniref:Uncharacterized protein n=1 Tax=Propioniciclava soli TaxID=2775081 RepID=A0ABZ3C6I3_9ACTN|nr:hypothetical protein [Propioniciclava soli]